MEWGNFWSSHLPRTYVDELLDNESLNPGEYVTTLNCDLFWCGYDFSGQGNKAEVAAFGCRVLRR
jgi:hypothetical protein